MEFIIFSEATAKTMFSKKAPSNLPNLPGVYLFKDPEGSIIYIGKATSLKQRVRSYFQENKDLKASLLMEEHCEVEHIVTPSETEAALLEAELVKKYQPRYNVLLKDGQPFVYILFTKDDPSRIAIVRNKKRKGEYFGPFLYKQQARSAHRYLLHTFRLNVCNKKIENGCLDYHLGTCPGTCKSDFDQGEYAFRIQLARDALKGSPPIFVQKNLQPMFLSPSHKNRA